MTIESLLSSSASALVAKGIHNGRQEALWLLEQVLGRRPSSLEREISAAATCEFRRLLDRRLDGEPLQYVMGSAEFYGLELEVGPGVLIPRPETERLVDFALERFHGGAICDLCTGSGAIALALAHERGSAHPVFGVDLSPEALRYARRNNAALNLEARVQFLQGDLFAPLPERQIFSLVTANPPYVSPSEYAVLPNEVADYEPQLALLAEDEGLAIFKRIAEDAGKRLESKGWLLCEIGSEQGSASAEILLRAGFRDVEILPDYSRRDRFAIGRTA